MMNTLEMPDTVNPVSPPNIPYRLPPNVIAKIKNTADTIVPNAPATAAFHRPPKAPSWAMYPVINPTISNPAN